MNKVGVAEIAQVVAKLRALQKRFMLVGACVRPFLLDEVFRNQLRPTMDVDVAIEAVSYSEFSRLEEKLRLEGFQDSISENVRIGSWIIDGVKVDIMTPYQFRGDWLLEGLENAVEREIAPGLAVPIVTPAYFFMMKMRAFRDRGKGDFHGSKDLEDIIGLVEGCPGLVAEIETLPKPIRLYVAASMQNLLDNPTFLDVLPGHLSSGSPKGTHERVLEVLRQIAFADSR